MNLFRGPFCVISSVDQAGSVKLDCLAALGGPVTHITASSVAVADRMIWPTFCIFAGLVMIGLPLLVILKLLRDSARSRTKTKASGKTAWLGSPPLDPDLEHFFPLLDQSEDFY